MKLNQIANKFFQLLGLASLIFVVLFVGLYFYFEQIIEAVNELEQIYDEKITIVNEVRANENKTRIESTSATERNESEPVSCQDWAKVWAKTYNVPEELLKKIIKAESGNNEKVENTNSTATGCAQFVIGTWRFRGKELWNDEFYNKNIYSPKDNVELLAWTISKYGTADWDASRSVWSK
jgi:soluble lytic murein transglycosylase-like protein